MERVAFATLIGIGLLFTLAAFTTPFTWPLVFVISAVGVHVILGAFFISLVFDKIVASEASKASPRRAVVKPQEKVPPQKEIKLLKLTAQEEKKFNKVAKAEFTHFHVQPSSGDGGGHGGNLQVTATSAKGKKHFFLKPLDVSRPAELHNYEYINKTDACDDLRQHMIGVHGKVKIRNQETKEEHYYLVMDDACKDDDGKKWKTVSDTKLAGKIKGMNPIACRNEIKKTDRKKGLLDFLQMWFGCLTAPNFLVYKGQLRILHFWRSKENFEKSIEDAGIAHLKQLKDDLEKMEKAMEKSRVAFIGASVIILQEIDPSTGKPKIGGALKAKLIDPAHIQVPAAGANPVYTGSKGYQRRFDSNRIAMKAIIDTVDGLIKHPK